MSGLSAAPSDSIQPQKTGEPCAEPSRKSQTAATSLPTITAFSVTQFLIWHLLICCRFLLVLPQGRVRGAGRRVGCSLCRVVGKKTSTLHSIVPLSVVLLLPHLRKIADKQILQVFCLLLFFFFYLVLSPICWVNSQCDRPGCPMPCTLLIIFLLLQEHSSWGVMEQWGRDAAPEEWYTQLWPCHFTLVATVRNIEPNSIYNDFRQM